MKLLVDLSFLARTSIKSAILEVNITFVWSIFVLIFSSSPFSTASHLAGHENSTRTQSNKSACFVLNKYHMFRIGHLMFTARSNYLTFSDAKCYCL